MTTKKRQNHEDQSPATTQAVKMTVKKLRTIIVEDYLHGVPEWQLRQDTSEYVDVIRGRIKSYILINKSETSSDQREAIAAMNDVCDELEKKLYDDLEDSLFNFVRRV